MKALQFIAEHFVCTRCSSLNYFQLKDFWLDIVLVWLYYTFDSDFVLQQKDLENLEKHMRKLIYADHIIKQSYISYNDAIELFEKLNLTETRKQLNYICPPKIPINTLGDFCDLYFAPLLVSTGILKLLS